ncbi:FtsX-like permease family protein, partial [Candidatus Saccharibacteria bacterium]|nr:FtsX-like permease family protein [Calditrichia bacterium]NIV71362.1 FtsX-like permease family protein [Calditrichia bacterium]NIV99227.1 FtsX-like permease family protein [Candidatus Saccharibacteria bacterium]NIW78170.1 FtsX-like permease family protein [Calditrichia bacterium]
YPVSLDSWGWISFHNYLLLDEQADPNHLEAKFPEFIKTHWSPERAEQFKWRLQPLKDIYFGDVLSPDLPSGNMAYIYGLIGIGVLILLMGCFNFMNLAIARSITRGREVGVRKVLGAFKGQLIRQYLGDSLLTSVFGLALAIALVEISMGILNEIFNLRYSVTAADYAIVLPVFLGLSVIVGLLSGSYPAFVISRFQPATVLKGNFKTGSAGLMLRKVLVIAQFTITIALIAGTVIISRQLNYISEKDLGFDQEEVVILSIPREEAESNYESLKTRLLQNPHVVSVSASGGLLDGNNGNVPIFPEGAGDGEGLPVNIYGVHFDFFETLRINVEEGRSLSPKFPTDTAEAVIL